MFSKGAPRTRSQRSEALPPVNHITVISRAALRRYTVRMEVSELWASAEAELQELGTEPRSGPGRAFGEHAEMNALAQVRETVR